jgi:excinuclease ABC subunit C
MQRSDITTYDVPDSPGVYFFLGPKKQILYIGKATSLRSRLRSYFTSDLAAKRSVLIEQMVDEATDIEWTQTDSVLEALILETNLIRTHKPRYNTRSKDDKSYNHVIITREEYPRVLVVRERDITESFTDDEIKYQFGPFPSAQMLRDALKIVRRLFKFYDTKRPVSVTNDRFSRGKIDFNRQIGLYPDAKNAAAYSRTIRHLRLFFEGKKHQVIEELRTDMMEYAQQENFEAAERCKRQIFALEHIQDVALLKRDTPDIVPGSSIRIEAYDIAHLAGSHMVGVMTVVGDGVAQKSEYRKFKIAQLESANDPAALRQVLERRLRHEEWDTPDLIVVDGNEVQKNVAVAVVRAYEKQIPVVAVTKNAQHKPSRLVGDERWISEHQNDILLANAEAHRFAVNFHRQRSRRMGRSSRSSS